MSFCPPKIQHGVIAFARLRRTQDDKANGKMAEPLLQTNLPTLPLLARGKVRDIYDLRERLPGQGLLIVATDRISVFDVVMPNGIPDKGRVLTAMSLFWFELTKDIVENHLITAEVSQYPQALLPYREQLEGRSMVVKKAQVLPVECVVRGYLAGSGWKEYQQSGTVCGIPLPAGLLESDKLPQPLFTPSTKALSGHDENITPVRAAEMVGAKAYAEIEARSLAVYQRAADYARQRGIIIADTKFEFGATLRPCSAKPATQGEEESGDAPSLRRLRPPKRNFVAREGGSTSWHEGRLILVDEVLTPDSSRFWPLDDYQPGRSQASFDKQPVRDYLEAIGWDKKPPAPELPPDVVAGTTVRYREAYRRLTGAEL